MKTRNLSILLVLTVMALPLAGCGGEQLPPGMPPPVPTDIIVTQEGQPLAGAVVRLVPADDDNPWDAIGRTDATGRAVVHTMDRFRGAVPGNYKVVISRTEQEQVDPAEVVGGGEGRPLGTHNLVEERFLSAATTPLEITAVRGTPTHTVDAGAVVRIRIIEDR